MIYSISELPALLDRYANEVIKPHILDWERNHHASTDIFTKAAELGLLGLETAKDKGGLGGRFTDKFMLASSLSEHSMAVPFALINSQNVAARLSMSATARHHEEIAPALRAARRVGCTALTEPGAGSDFAAIQTSATKTDGGWIISGTKAWITNAATADTIMLYAQTDPEKGWRGIASFLIDAHKPGFKRGKIYDLIGGHAIGAGEFHLNDYYAPDEDMLAPPGEAFKIAMSGINGARTYVAAMCIGMIRNALNQAILYGKERKSFGQPLLSHQGLKWSLVDVRVQLESLTLLAEKAAREIDQESPNAVLSAAMAKKLAGEITIPAITACIQSMGANGLLEEKHLGHHLACAKIAAYTDGSTEIMNDRIAASFHS